MEKLLHNLMRGGSIAATLAAASVMPAWAQDANNAGVEQVVVSASRVSIAGYAQPTPVTVLSSESLDRDAQPSIADSIRQLPAVGASTSPSVGSGGIAGAAAGTEIINLRNLGAARTLVLFDGQRVVSSGLQAPGTDLSTVPEAIIQRIDIVTGGASASWGSDAVAGVVNIVINKNFSGFKGNIEGSDTSYDNFGFKEEAAFGSDFAGGNGHFIVSASHFDSPTPVFFSQIAGYNTSLVKNPAYAAGNGQPQLIHQYLPNLAMQTQGGLINSGPLAGIQFTGTAATPAPFNQGTIATNPSGGPTLNSVGGTPNPAAQEAYPYLASQPYHKDNLFLYARYKLTDSIQASFQFDYGSNRVQVTSGTIESSYAVQFNIHNDNAYLPQSIVSAMAANNITSFTLGSTGLNNVPAAKINNLTLQDMLGQSIIPISQNSRQMLRGVATLEGQLGNDWSWNAYYQHGTVALIQHVFDNPVKPYLANAVDAVYVTAANRGASGLPVGSIACRSTLTNPTNGCQPYDIFGLGNVSQASLNYIFDGYSDINHSILSEDVAAASMQGVLPWGLPAGKVAVAFGGEYRNEQGHLNAAPIAQASNYTNGNASNFRGAYNVEEGFLEVDAPLLKNDFVESLDASAAGRITNYSTSGLVETWKLGLTSQVDDDIRLRTTWSLDIRAPNLNELFATPSGGAVGQVDPKTGKNVPLVLGLTSGNPNLKPEVSTTVSGGVVLTPHWVPGLSASFDWYSINIKGAVYTLSAAIELQQCANGNNFYCSFLDFNGPNGALSATHNEPANAASETASGLDFQVDYTMDLFSGTLDWQFIGNYTDEETETTSFLGAVDFAGGVGPDQTFGGFPKFRSTLSATYKEGPVSATIQGRFIGAAVLNNAWNFNNFVDNNYVPGQAYLDVRASYQLTDNFQIYGAMDNVTGVPAPLLAYLNTTPFNNYTNPAIYDGFGRQYRMGLHINF